MMPRCPPRYVAIVPAAGASRRMGRSKLLLPWRSSTVLQTVLETWSQSEVDRTVLVVRAVDQDLAAIGRGCGADVVVAHSPPPEMKDSVRLALDYVRQQYGLDQTAWWLLSPADNPCLDVAVVNRVCRACAASDAEIVVASHAGKGAHPVALVWPLADEVAGLAKGEGVSALLNRHRVERVDVDDPGVLEDLDTPEDYDRLR